jgi:iron-sulfur cluster assembly accessory protein
MAIRVTASAVQQLAKRGPNVLFHCRSGGCNGFEYVLEPVEKVDDAEKQKLSENVTLWTCNHSIFHLLGTEIDWKEDMMGSRFVFSNPNANSACGCGATFST